MDILTILFYLIFALTGAYIGILYIFSKGFGHIKTYQLSNERPSVTVIVCAHNEQMKLPVCLDHLKKQTYDGSVEFIIVDDRSIDRTNKIISGFCKEDSRFKLITIVDRIAHFAPKKRAIDTAIRQAHGEIILLTDSDGRPGPSWVNSMIEYFDSGVDMVLGYAPYSVIPAKHFSKKTLALEYLSHASIAAASTGIGFPVTCVGTNMAYRKKLYQDIGGFGEFKAFISGDDDLFLTRVREAKKYKIRYASDARTHVYNPPPKLWAKFVHQRMRYASKGFNYPIKVTAGLILYFTYNLLILSGLVAVLFDLRYFFLTLIAYLLKSIAEIVFISKAARTLNDRRYEHLIPIVQIFHIPYIVLFAILGQFKRFRWAEDKSESAIQKEVLEST